MKQPTHEMAFKKFLTILECQNFKEFSLSALKKMEETNATITKDNFKKCLQLYFEEQGYYKLDKEISDEFRENELKKLINRIANRLNKEIHIFD